MTSTARRTVTNLARMALSLLALGLLLQQVGGRQVLLSLRAADGGLLIVAWGLFLAGIVVRAFRWQALLHGLGLRPPFGLLLKLYFVGGFFNTFLPSGFGGDAVRVLELSHGSGDASPQSAQAQSVSSAALGTVLVDRITGILSSMALGLVVLPFARGLPPAVAWLFGAISIAGLGAGALLLEGRLLRRLTSRLPAAVSLAGEGKLAQIYAAITGSGSRALWMALALSTVFNLINITVIWLCALAMGIGLPISFHFVVGPLLSLTLLLPISVGGLGARDWLAQMLMAPTAIPDTMTAAWTLSMWAISAAAGFIGGVIYLWQGISGFVRSRRYSQDGLD